MSHNVPFLKDDSAIFLFKANINVLKCNVWGEVNFVVG